jgi:hypothetical protein
MAEPGSRVTPPSPVLSVPYGVFLIFIRETQHHEWVQNRDPREGVRSQSFHVEPRSPELTAYLLPCPPPDPPVPFAWVVSPLVPHSTCGTAHDKERIEDSDRDGGGSLCLLSMLHQALIGELGTQEGGTGCPHPNKVTVQWRRQTETCESLSQ